MLHGTEDGDALFFSGDLEISGDTGAVLALRNALDDAELDLTEELAALAGGAGPLLRQASRMLARASGLVLGRAGALP
jgi:predicted lipid carrier protein YhbT